jgi:hypothetical protein
MIRTTTVPIAAVLGVMLFASPQPTIAANDDAANALIASHSRIELVRSVCRFNAKGYRECYNPDAVHNNSGRITPGCPPGMAQKKMRVCQRVDDGVRGGVKCSIRVGSCQRI